MELTQWFCWISVAGAIIGLVAAVQQLLIYGLLPFVRAVIVTAAAGLLWMLFYTSRQEWAPSLSEVNLTPAEAASTVPLAINPTPFEPGAAPLCPPTVKTTPVTPLPVNSAPVTPAPGKPGRTESVALRPTLPTLLPAQRTLFSPSEVAYCPLCFVAYSAKGPVANVTCVHCDKVVNLVFNPDYTVYRCGKCGRLFRTQQPQPPNGPYGSPYYCPFCRP